MRIVSVMWAIGIAVVTTGCATLDQQDIDYPRREAVWNHAQAAHLRDLIARHCVPWQHTVHYADIQEKCEKVRAKADKFADWGDFYQRVAIEEAQSRGAVTSGGSALMAVGMGLAGAAAGAQGNYGYGGFDAYSGGVGYGPFGWGFYNSYTPMYSPAWAPAFTPISPRPPLLNPAPNRYIETSRGHIFGSDGSSYIRTWNGSYFGSDGSSYIRPGF